MFGVRLASSTGVRVHLRVIKKLAVVFFTEVGTWGAWGLFDTCTKTCDGGKKTRTRQCNHSAGYMPIPCPGSNSETVDCNTGLCPSKFFISKFIFTSVDPQNEQVMLKYALSLSKGKV